MATGDSPLLSTAQNQSNDFYKLWLDPAMAYTCAYFARPGMSLQEAQKAKFDHVARKLRLKPGQHVVEAGCGWGGMAVYLAQKFGVTVQAWNISREQIVRARDLARTAGGVKPRRTRPMTSGTGRVAIKAEL